MRITLGLFTVALSLWTTSTLANGGVKGTVSFAGTVPKEKEIKMNADPGCVKQTGGKAVMSDRVVVNGGKLKNVLVYLKDVKGSFTPPKTPVELDQQACMYHPHVIGMMAKQPLKIINSDPLLHNVHSMAKINKKDNFNSGMAVKGQTITKTFGKEEIAIKVKCDVHGWMSSYIGVFKHPFYAVTDDKGAFELKDVPDGDYTLAAWHEKFKTEETKVSVKGGVVTADLTYKK